MQHRQDIRMSRVSGGQWTKWATQSNSSDTSLGFEKKIHKSTEASNYDIWTRHRYNEMMRPTTGHGQGIENGEMHTFDLQWYVIRFWIHLVRNLIMLIVLDSYHTCSRLGSDIEVVERRYHHAGFTCHRPGSGMPQSLKGYECAAGSGGSTTWRSNRPVCILCPLNMKHQPNLLEPMYNIKRE